MPKLSEAAPIAWGPPFKLQPGQECPVVNDDPPEGEGTVGSPAARRNGLRKGLSRDRAIERGMAPCRHESQKCYRQRI